jgi:hypothetical protein
MNKVPLLELRGIEKLLPGVKALSEKRRLAAIHHRQGILQ